MTLPTLRPELAKLPRAMRSLPLDPRGYPIPWFVARVNGAPEFRVADEQKWIAAIRERRCWVCGGHVTRNDFAFLIGPMCGVNRTTAEPGCHIECADWSAVNCPFLARPHMRRREDDAINDLVLQEQSAGMSLARNPGASLVWVTRSFTLFHGPGKLPLITIGEPTAARWYTEGRAATRVEALAAIERGLPSLIEVALLQAGAIAELHRRVVALMPWLPPGDSDPPETIDQAITRMFGETTVAD